MRDRFRDVVEGNLMLLFMPIISIAKIPRIREILSDCIQGRIRFMTAITFACQATCLARYLPGVLYPNFLLPKAKSQISVSSQCLFPRT